MLKAVAEILERRGTDGWLVGGSVRDRLLGRYSPDLDVAVADDAAAVAKESAAALHAPWFALSERHPTYRVLSADGYLDVAAVRGDILTDLGLRDFTVNALAIPVASGLVWDAAAILDPFGGLGHLKERRLVAVSEHLFADDPLRLMRAARFRQTLGLRWDEDLARKIRGQAAELAGAAAERTVSEMCLTLAAGRAAAAVRLWDDLGLLEVVLPELGAGTAPPDRSATLSLLERLDDMVERPASWFPEAGDMLSARLAEPVDGLVTRPVALRLAGLTHGLGSEDVRGLGRRLKLSGAMGSLLSAVARISVPKPVGQMDEAGEIRPLEGLLPGDTAISRPAVLFLWEAAPWEAEVIMLAAAADGGQGSRLTAARRLMCLHARRAGGRMPSLPLDGHALMRELGLEPGPILGRALREARLAWEAGEARSLAEVLAAAKVVATQS